MRYDVVGYDGAGEFPPLTIADVPISRVASSLRSLELARGVALSFGIIYRSGESIVRGVAVRSTSRGALRAWSLSMIREL